MSDLQINGADIIVRHRQTFFVSQPLLDLNAFHSADGSINGSAPVAIADVRELSAKDRGRTGIGELDRVLGGGFVIGSLVLLGGDPGIGKSTLLIQALAGLAQHTSSGNGVLYATGEESVAQTAMRARRVGAADANLSVVAETDVERILAHAQTRRPAILAVDSIWRVPVWI